MKYPHRVTIYRRAAAATADSRGRNALNLSAIATDYPCDIQRKDGDVVHTDRGAIREGTWTGYFRPGLTIKPTDLVKITRRLRDGDAIPTTYEVKDAEAIGGRWDTEAQLSITTEATPP